MTDRLLDVNIFPTTQDYECEDGHVIRVDKIVHGFFGPIQALMANNIIDYNDSFGFAMTKPVWEGDDDATDAWDDPVKYVYLVVGWGPKGDALIANAVRKLRALLRPLEGMPNGPYLAESTLDIRFDHPRHFMDKVDSVDEDDNFPWGDFPWGGAAFVQTGQLITASSVSGFTEVQDDFVSRLITATINEAILVGDGMLPPD